MNTELVQEHSQAGRRSLFGPRWLTLGLILAGTLILSLVIRLDGLTDPPLDFHPTRQLHSALIARGMYYENLPTAPEWQRRMAVVQMNATGALEPRLMEALAVIFYRLTGAERLWIPRLFSILFWVLGSIPLYFLAKNMGGRDGGLIATLFYLFTPYAIIASRSFQPEPLMIATLILALWGLYHWYQSPNWRWALFAGILACLAIFVKAVMVLPIIGAMTGLFLASRGIKKSVRDPQVWTIILLATLPYLLYFIYGTQITHSSSERLSGRFIPELLIQPWFYLRWELKINQVVGHVFLALALIGLFFFKSKVDRWFMLGLWAGYLIYGLIFNYQISTHDYYHISLVPMVALSLAPLSEWIIQRLIVRRGVRRGVPWVLLSTLLVVLTVTVWRTHERLHQIDYRPEVALYKHIGEKIGRRFKVVALTEDYGYRLAYWGWLNARVWPSYGDLSYQEKLGRSTSDFEKRFSKLTAGMDYFVVTWPEELELQPLLKEHLFRNFLLYEQGGDYLIFDLSKPSAWTEKPAYLAYLS